ncbi:hypothetical protein [uncultured Mycobacterium sp.]|uniref:hypothetical protein n=1 Tax=uncultured Mycobacterium sp. TaxID=171292 RepID=UPI0035CBA244
MGFAAVGTATVVDAQPAQFPQYHWCPGDSWDPSWGNNWDRDRCHDDHWYDGDPHDLEHWDGTDPYSGGRGIPGSPGVAPGTQRPPAAEWRVQRAR